MAMTANAMERDVEACLAAGTDEHISKPIDAAEFLRVIRRVLDVAGDAYAPGDAELPDVDAGQLEGLASLLPAARLSEMW